jgi:hypothetical protein
MILNREKLTRWRDQIIAWCSARKAEDEFRTTGDSGRAAYFRKRARIHGENAVDVIRKKPAS